MNTFGKHFRLTTFGESHGRALGAVIDGCPAGVEFSIEVLKKHLDRRRPGRFAWQTSRLEPDEPEVLSGVFEGKTIGSPIAILVKNKNARPKDYTEIKNNPRAGHADDLWKDKFGWYDWRGGGRASGRETVSRVIGGALAGMFLNAECKDFQVLSYLDQVGPVKLEKNHEDFIKEFWDHPEKLESYPAYFPDKKKSEDIKNLLLSAKEEGQSYGASVVTLIKGVPRGLGRPVFHKLKADLTSALMGIGAVFSVSIGRGDPNGKKFHENPKNYGGLRGGISTGEIIELKIGFKPPSSVNETARLGRHDPCIAPRAVPVIEAMVNLVTADHALSRRLDRIS